MTARIFSALDDQPEPTPEPTTELSVEEPRKVLPFKRGMG
jgi:hypothetical protein